MIENIFHDRRGGNTTNAHMIGIRKLSQIKNKHNPVDLWGKSNPYKRHFTYHIGDNTIHRRLDRIFITKRIKTKTRNILSPSIFGPNSVSVTIQVNKKEPKGPGVWKLNTAILKHKNFQNRFQQFWKNLAKRKNKISKPNRLVGNRKTIF